MELVYQLALLLFLISWQYYLLECVLLCWLLWLLLLGKFNLYQSQLECLMLWLSLLVKFTLYQYLLECWLLWFCCSGCCSGVCLGCCLPWCCFPGVASLVGFLVFLGLDVLLACFFAFVLVAQLQVWLVLQQGRNSGHPPN